MDFRVDVEHCYDLSFELKRLCERTHMVLQGLNSVALMLQDQTLGQIFDDLHTIIYDMKTESQNIADCAQMLDTVMAVYENSERKVVNIVKSLPMDVIYSNIGNTQILPSSNVMFETKAKAPMEVFRRVASVVSDTSIYWNGIDSNYICIKYAPIIKEYIDNIQIQWLRDMTTESLMNNLSILPASTSNLKNTIDTYSFEQIKRLQIDLSQIRRAAQMLEPEK